MQIHVVEQGESLWQIAQTYGVPYQAIVDANQLPNQDQLVIGQAIVVPIEGRFHWLKQGETLRDVSRLYQVPVQEIAEVNQFRSTELIQANAKVYVPKDDRQKPTIEVGAYVDLGITGEESPQYVDQVGEFLTYLQIFSYEVNADATLTPINDQAIINTAYQNRVVPLMVITNLEEGLLAQRLQLQFCKMKSYKIDC